MMCHLGAGREQGLRGGEHSGEVHGAKVPHGNAQFPTATVTGFGYGAR